MSKQNKQGQRNGKNNKPPGRKNKTKKTEMKKISASFAELSLANYSAKEVELDKKEEELDERQGALSMMEIFLNSKKTELNEKESELNEKEARLSAKEVELKSLIITTIGDRWKNLDFLKDHCLRVYGKRVRTFHEGWKYIFPSEYQWIKEEQDRLSKMTKEELVNILDGQRFTRSTCEDYHFRFDAIVDKAKCQGTRVDVYYNLFNIEELIEQK
jgi:hypothetical protein